MMLSRVSFNLLRGARASIGRTAMVMRAPSIPLVASQRLYSTSESTTAIPPTDSAHPRTGADLDTLENSLLADEASADPETPWYLTVDPPTSTAIHHGSAKPTLPEGSPSILEHLVNHAYDDAGLDDLTILDLRAFDPPPSARPRTSSCFFGTARSERHLHVVAARAQRWLRYNFHINASADGLIGAGELRTKLRRLRKKAKIMGAGSVIPLGGDDGISTGWICLNLGTLGNNLSEDLKLDPKGKMSGFGGSDDGTTVVLQIMTAGRRSELNLELLWKRNLESNAKMHEKLAAEGDIGHVRKAVPNNWDKRLRRKRKRAEQKGFDVSGEDGQEGQQRPSF